MLDLSAVTANADERWGTVGHCTPDVVFCVMYLYAQSAAIHPRVLSMLRYAAARVNVRSPGYVTAIVRPLLLD